MECKKAILILSLVLILTIFSISPICAKWAWIDSSQGTQTSFYIEQTSEIIEPIEIIKQEDFVQTTNKTYDFSQTNYENKTKIQNNLKKETQINNPLSNQNKKTYSSFNYLNLISIILIQLITLVLIAVLLIIALKK